MATAETVMVMMETVMEEVTVAEVATVEEMAMETIKSSIKILN